VPQFSYFGQAVVTRLIQMRHNIRETAVKEGINLTYMPFFIRALSMTAKQYPFINASVDMQNGAIVIHKVQNIGVAMASEHGLIVPVLKGVESMGLNEIIRGYEELKTKALQKHLLPSDMKDATLTISNFGVLGGDGMWATPMINEPETAIVALAKIRKAPVVKAGEMAVFDVLPLSWSFDHRVIDGELAAHISHYFCTLLKDPAFLL
jgi:pyruvate dehydrogenase E2 component (dihydrolipoamide acetyltransferase)